MPFQEPTRAAVVDMIMESDYEDVLVLDAVERQELLTTERQRLLGRISEYGGESVSELAEALNRDPAAVSRDLKTLFEYDVIEYRKEGKEKVPLPKHKSVLFASFLDTS
jgi:predicted transcriptional regulator